jgi:16S rRNA (cytidine1402-2'-O)-methyltransferase
MSGKLALVATPIGNLGDLSDRSRRCLAEADGVLAEDTRRARALLTHLGIAHKRVDRFDANVEARDLEGVLSRLEGGAALALVSDAGTPGVSDPGAALVRAAAARGIAVSPIPGPSAVLAALAASGFGGSRFRFFGFLPRGGNARREALAALLATEEVAIFFESPTRAAATLAELAERSPEREAVVARELTKLHEEFVRGTLADLAGRAAWQGEITIVLGPMAAAAAVIDVEARIAALTAEGLRDKDVAKAIALETGMAAGDAYRLVVTKKDRT